MRGQQANARRAYIQRRIIPARAGPTVGSPNSMRRFLDHPRSCGANRTFVIAVIGVRGSSPLVRGQPVHRFSSHGNLRIIPARAGPTTRLRDSTIKHADHPRSCGANVIIHRNSLAFHGSSPLVRGQHLMFDLQPLMYRIIPARAGPTSSSSEMMASTSDHPRSCGANAVRGQGRERVAGSSPLVRGQH